jgi:hypothetical protein
MESPTPFPQERGNDGQALRAFRKDGSAGRRGRLLVLGIGNLLWADEGFGVRCVEQLARSGRCRPA